MEDLNAKGKLAEIFKELDQKYGAGNYSLRKISRLRDGVDTPSLSLRKELDKLKLKVGDTVLIAVVGNKLIIEPI
jgi:hypothetical protein